MQKGDRVRVKRILPSFSTPNETHPGKRPEVSWTVGHFGVVTNYPGKGEVVTVAFPGHEEQEHAYQFLEEELDEFEQVTLVFQYGSNCLESQMNSQDRLCGDAKFISIADTVEDFELGFDVWATRRGCAASDIVRKTGEKVWGVLYAVPNYLIGRETAAERGRKSFDALEGESTNYKREIIKVRLPNGDIVDALTYTVKVPQTGLRTNAEYAGYIIRGLREHGVSQEYISKVKKLAITNNPGIATEIEKL